MPNFLELVAHDLFKRYGDSISDVTLVFPSQRAGLFFNTYLAKHLNKPIWSPIVMSISNLMQQLSGLAVSDPIVLVTNLYRIYNRIKGTSEPFENFYFWGEVMLTDFDQLDKYLVDPKQLFTNIKDIKDIEERFGGLTPEQTEALRDYLGAMTGSKVSELRENYLSVWGILLDIYTQFNAELADNGNAYEGMMYRKAAQILKDPTSEIDLPKQVAFIGFNALNECERALLHRCKIGCEALFYWDYDPTFVNNPEHEAGLFIRRNLQQFPNALTQEQLWGTKPEKRVVKLVAAPSTVTQAKLLPQILGELKERGARFDVSTAVILPKENILIPTLQSITNEVEQLNITIGYPIRETPAFGLAECLVRLQSNASTSSEGTLRFYHVDVTSLLNHPYLRHCEPEHAQQIASEIRRNNRIYPNANELTKSPLLQEIFSAVSEGNSLCQYLLSICGEISKRIASRADSEGNEHIRIDLEFLFALHKSLTRLEGVISTLEFEVPHRLLLQLLRKIFTQERVSFSGEPLAGLQVMGFLETRALDFENIIVLSFNDDVLPGRSYPVSFITPSLRVAFGLPDHKHHDAVYAYYFYRLLNRAKNVYLVYSSRSEGISSGEKSRFGLQLEMEQMVGKVENISVNYSLSITPTLPISIDKTERVMQALTSRLNRNGNGVTLSPSGITSYISCPMRFYFRYAVGIDDPEEVSEEVGALEFGRIIHSAMEEIYKDFNGQTITKQVISSIIKEPQRIERILDLQFIQIFLKSSTASLNNLSGRNLLARNAMLYTLNKMLRLDMDRAPFLLVQHEKQVFVTVEVSGSSICKQVQLGGYVDRIENNNGTIWSIDYKTGRHSDKKGVFSSVDELFNPQKINDRKEVFQTFCYCLALRENYPNNPLKPALWFVKNAKDAESFSIYYTENKPHIPVNDFRVFENDFKDGLSNLLGEIFNPSIPFTQTADIEKCKTCPFVNICGISG